MDRETVERIASRHYYRRADSEAVPATLREALRSLAKRDAVLLQRGAAERAICHRLTVYLEAVVNADLRDDEAWHVDCEYNLYGDDPARNETIADLHKRLLVQGVREDDGDESPHLVYPDIIVHRRGTDDNLLVVEVKVLRDTTKWAKVCFDFRKLAAFREPLRGFAYRVSAFVLVVPGDVPELVTYLPSGPVL